MYEYFTDGMRQVLKVARDEAYGLNHPYIGTDHLLLGLLRCSQGEVAEQVLAERGLALDAVHAQIVRIVGCGMHPFTGEPPFTPGAQSLLQALPVVAGELRDVYIGTAHLLLAFLDYGEGVGPTVLFRLLDLDRDFGPNRNFIEIRRRVIQLHCLR